MGPWRYTIDIGREFAACRRFLEREMDNLESEDEAISPAECGKRVAAKIRSNPAFRMEEHEGTLEGIALDLESLDNDGGTNDFDDALKRLYDWADSWWPDARLCWINTDVRHSNS